MLHKCSCVFKKDSNKLQFQFCRGCLLQYFWRTTMLNSLSFIFSSLFSLPLSLILAPSFSIFLTHQVQAYSSSVCVCVWQNTHFPKFLPSLIVKTGLTLFRLSLFPSKQAFHCKRGMGRWEWSKSTLPLTTTI